MIGQAIRWKLSTLNLPLGIDPVNQGVYPNAAPEGSLYPKIVYQVISHQRVKSLVGYSGLAHPRVQIDIYGQAYGDCDTIANLLIQRGGLDDPAGLPAYWQSVLVQSCRIISQRDFYIPPQSGDTQSFGVHRISQDYELWYVEKTS